MESKLCDLNVPFSADAGANVLEKLTFGQEADGSIASGMSACVQEIFEYFLNARQRGGSSAANVSHLQIAFIITDAIFDDESRKKVPHWIRRASSKTTYCNDNDRQSGATISLWCCFAQAN